MTISELLSLGGICAVVIAVGAFYFWYQYWCNPRWARLTGERLQREETDGIPPTGSDYHYAIAFDAIGFTVTDPRNDGNEPFGMRWEEVYRTTVFKRDCGTVDCICMFLARFDGTGVELDEGMARWKTLIEALPQHLASCKSPAEWFSKVAFPAFQTNETEIYRRNSNKITQI